MQVPTPAKRDLSMVYLEAFRHSTIVVRLELFVGQGALSPDAAALEDPEDTSGACGNIRISYCFYFSNIYLHVMLRVIHA